MADDFQSMRSRARAGSLGGSKATNSGTLRAGEDAAGKRPPIVNVQADQRTIPIAVAPPYPQTSAPNENHS